MQIMGKAAVVTGGSSGIGRAIAVALAERGGHVIIADINEEGGRKTVDIIDRAGGIATYKHCDTTRTEDIAGALAAAYEHWKRLDIVCNNAGVGDVAEDFFGEVESGWRNVVEVNLAGVIDGTRIAVREMQRLGGGVVINTASMGGLVPMPGAPVYAATKAAVVNFTRSLGYLGEECNVRVNAICPTFTDTALIRKSPEAGARIDEIQAQVGGILEPEEVADGVVELVEDDSRAGAIMRVTVRGSRDYAREIRP